MYFTISKDLTIISADQPNIEDVQLSFQDYYAAATFCIAVKRL